jgi:hypothetical protein
MKKPTSLLYQELKLIETRPGMYIGQASVRLLFHYILGYRAALNAAGIIDRQSPPFVFYDEWLRLQLTADERKLSCSWAECLYLIYQDDAKALDAFFKFFHTFLKLKIKGIELIQDTAKHTAWHVSWSPGDFSTLYRLNQRNKITDYEIISSVFSPPRKSRVMDYVKHNWKFIGDISSFKITGKKLEAAKKKVISIY